VGFILPKYFIIIDFFLIKGYRRKEILSQKEALFKMVARERVLKE
jgi:hypothetical protein